jgi:hypothetical protein
MKLEGFKPLVHIGYHKTGTSWLQAHLYSEKSDVFYPMVDPAWDEIIKGQFPSQQFGNNFMYSETGKVLVPGEFSVDRVERKISQLNDDRGRIPVISHERLSGHPSNGGIDTPDICDRLHQTFANAKVLIVIREQKSLILSWYSQYLKSGGVLSLYDYIRDRYDDGLVGFNKKYFEFHRLISLYLKVFGKDNVLVLPYEDFRSDSEGFIGKLYQFLGTQGKTKFDFNEKVNETKSGWYLSKFRILNYFTRYRGANGFSPFYLGKLIYKIENSIKKRAHILIPDSVEKRHLKKQKDIVANEMGGYYSNSNRITEDLTGIDLKSLGYE